MKKKILSVMLALYLAAGTATCSDISIKVYAQEQEQTEGGYQYKVLDDGTAVITNYVGEDTKISIPSEIGGKKVTGIGEGAFVNRKNLEEVAIPAGVTSIGNGAFANCTNLKEAVIPVGVTSIGNTVFSCCTNLKEAAIPAGVTSIGYSAFDSCTNLDNISIPDSVTSIGWRAFCSCTSLKRINIPAGVADIDGSAFSDCMSLEYIDVDGNNELYASVDGVLYSKDKKTLLVCPGGKQGSLAIPAGVAGIGEDAFASCTGLKRIGIPDSVTDIYLGTFCMTPNGDAGLEAIEVSAGNPVYSSIDGILCSKDGKTLFVCPQGKHGSLDIPAGITDIGNASFEYCTELANVTIPNTVTSIGECVFHGAGLKSISIPESVISIGELAFAACRSLESVSISDGVASIGDGAFGGCWSLKDVYYVGNEEQWKKIDVKAGNDELLGAVMHYDSNGSETVIENPDNSSKPIDPLKPDESDKQDPSNQPVTPDDPVTVPNDPVTAPNDSSITPSRPVITSPEQPTDQTEVTTSDSTVSANVLEKGESCQVGANSYRVSKTGSEVIFTQTSAKQNVVVPSAILVGGTSYKVTAIMANALIGNKKIKKITIGKNVKTIGKNAFKGCTNLKTIIIQSTGLRKVEKNALKGIHPKAKIKVPGSKFKAYKKLLKGKGQGKKVMITK